VRLGNPVLLRSIYRDAVRWCWPHHYAGEWDGRRALYVQPGARGKLIGRALDGGYLEYWASGAPSFDWTWQDAHVLRFMRPGDRHTVEVWWDVDWELKGWYVNLQAPLVVRGSFFDTTDHALDIVVEPDGTWSWKDEDDLAEMVARGLLAQGDADGVRAEGERVLAEQPWPTGWEGWRPSSEWKPLPLPEDWHVV
jgi:Protein of unknown function (DUF402)